MFESDDFDQVLSQFDFPDVSHSPRKEKENNEVLIHNHRNEDSRTNLKKESNKSDLPLPIKPPMIDSRKKEKKTVYTEISSSGSSKHVKRKMIDSLFDHNSKRKFPGPAGLLTGSLEENNDQTICQMELFSQDLDFSQCNNQKGLFESPLWTRLLEDLKTWNMCEVNAIKQIKLQAVAGNLWRRKAQTVTAFVETIDRSAVDPLITLRDKTGSIKCTLHRDAWSSFSPFIVSDYCAVVLWKPTVLTTGGAFKKHYLNITLSNIYAIYSSAVLNIEDATLPEGYTRISEEDFTVIKNENPIHNSSSEVNSSNSVVDTNNKNEFMEELDSIFSDVF